MSQIVRIRPLGGRYAVARLDAGSAVPDWADGDGFVSISRTDDELSVVCLEQRVPANVRHEGGWLCTKFEGPFAFTQTGIVASVVGPLAQAAVPVFVVSTFDTDYLLLKAVDFERAKNVLIQSGHVFL